MTEALRVFAHGGGVQSTAALVLWVERLRAALGRVLALHAPMALTNPLSPACPDCFGGIYADNPDDPRPCGCWGLLRPVCGHCVVRLETSWIAEPWPCETVKTLTEKQHRPITDTPNAEPNNPGQPEPDTIIYLDPQERTDARALGMRRQGASYEFIAREMGCARSVAWDRVQRGLAKEKAESPQAKRQLLSAGLDEMMLRMRGIALSRDSTRMEAIKAAEQYIKASERASKLTGAESPTTRVQVVKFMDEDERRAERERLDAELEAAGVDLSVLPSIESIAMKLLASRDKHPDHPAIPLTEHAESLRDK